MSLSSVKKPYILILVLIVLPLATVQTQEQVSKVGGLTIVKRGDAPAVLEPEVNFLSEAPKIDGILDEGLESLPAREFTHVLKHDPDNPVIPCHYRLAYGTDFFYVYVEAEADKLTFRDRAYQNGDGFIVLLALPKPKDSPTDEFYVLACSAVDKPRMEWTRRIFWYYNVDTIFLRPSEDTRMEFRAAGGKISFELIVPWEDVHPYHPWISEGIGFNIAFVKACEENNSKNFNMLLPDRRIGSEYQNRIYCRLKFEEPRLEGKPQTFVLPGRNHIQQGKSLKAVAVTVSSDKQEEQLYVLLKSGEGTRINYKGQNYHCESGVTRHEFTLEGTGSAPPGGYRVEWISRNNDSRGESGLTILPEFDFESLNTRLDGIEKRLAPSSYTTFQFLLQEIKEQLTKVKPYETCAAQRIRLARLLHYMDKAEAGVDVFAARRGLIRKAYRSKLDDTLQPYCVVVPEDFDPAKKYPLLVFLHGSASDETNIAGSLDLIPKDFIALGPRGRGPSNAYTVVNAQEDIAEAIDAVMASYPIDKENIILSGFSMGGYGVYRTYYETPEKFKALVVLSGHPNIGNKYGGGQEHPNFLEEKYLKIFRNVPIFIFHGKRDRNCPFRVTEQLVGKLKDLGAEVEFVVEEDKGHEHAGEATVQALREWLGSVISRND